VPFTPAPNSANIFAMSKSVFVKTYGCQMNVYDSARMQDVLAPLGYRSVESAEDADLVILNTCHIREKAVEKVYSELGRYRDLKEARGGAMTIAVAGCVGQAEGAEITRRMKSVDLVFGPQTYHRLPELLKQREDTGLAVVETEFAVDYKFKGLATEQVRNPKSRSVTAFLTIQEGCDKFCTFCVVPYTRGAEFSRAPAQILEEAQKLADQGVREVTLLGQNVNAYSNGSATLASLITKLSHISGIDRIRYMTSHPRDMSDDLIAAHGENPKLMPYLHLPVQSGSSRVLKAMNRGHSAEDYVKLIERIRVACPSIALTSDFIVGFPGETDADFDETLDLVKQVKYANAYSFKYSQRPGTPAAARDDQVDEDVKNDRLARLQALLISQQSEFNQSCLGQTMTVLLEKLGRQKGQLIGRSPYLQSVHIQAPESEIGSFVNAEILSVGPNSLSGHYVSPTLTGGPNL
jgi:tRNA-2-methylthio-N6-dimethylallyladenosine synthase